MEQLISQEVNFDVKKLYGKTLKLLPYARGFCPRDILYHLWSVLESEGLTNFVFHSHFENGTPYRTTGDLVEFVKLFDDPNRCLLIAVSLENRIVGAIWFDDIVRKFKASISIFMIKGYRKEAAIEAVHLALDYAFHGLGIQTVWAITPWLHAANLARNTGFKTIVTVPDMLPQENGDKDLHILRIKREEFDHGAC